MAITSLFFIFAENLFCWCFLKHNFWAISTLFFVESFINQQTRNPGKCSVRNFLKKMKNKKVIVIILERSDFVCIYLDLLYIVFFVNTEFTYFSIEHSESFFLATSRSQKILYWQNKNEWLDETEYVPSCVLIYAYTTLYESSRK